jgi:hypothetical protein
MRIPAFLQLKKREARGNGLVANPDLVSKSALLFLIVLLASVLLFDGHLFFFRVAELDRELVDIGDAQSNVPDVQKSLLQRARAIGEKRKATFVGVASSTPVASPFAIPVAPTK